jgi:hypothetical protein
MRACRARFILLSLCILPAVAGATTLRDLSKAAEQRKIAFVLVTDPAAAGVEAARDLARQVMKHVERSVLIELDRSEPANADLVAQYRLAGAPLPVILVVGRNGVLGGGLIAAAATPELLMAQVPSPKKSEVMAALQTGKAVFLQASRKSMGDQIQLAGTCATACRQMAGKAVLIPVDMDDPAEAGFLGQMKIDLAATAPVTIVINPQGQITATYNGVFEAANLVEASAKRVGGCCPATVQDPNASCAPKK